MNKQKKAEKLLEETLRFIQEMDVLGKNKTRTTLLEDRSVVVVDAARFQILEEKFKSFSDKLSALDDKNLEKDYDVVVELHETVSEMRSILRTLTGM